MKIKTVKRFLIMVSLVCCLVILSAFGFEQKKTLLTRLDLAIMIERILERMEINSQGENLPKFIDLGDDQLLSVFKTLSLKIMAGYPDGSFRPDEPLRNLETICYLQKLARCLRKNTPDAYETRQLMRIFAYQSQPEVILSDSLPAGAFPSELGEAGAHVEKRVLQDLLAALLTKTGRYNVLLSGRVINAVTGNPLPGACIAAGKLAVVADESGSFTIDLSGISHPDVVLFAAAEGFNPVELKKDLRLSPNITFRLKPEKKAAAGASVSGRQRF